MKEQSSIPTSKVARATQFVKTGVKIGGNYLKYSAKKFIDPTTNKDELHQDNAGDIYASLSEMKGSALKVTQMLSMDKGMLPRAYREKFAMSQYSAPPLSGPLVVKTFRKLLGKSPQEIFDTFEMNAANAASIGQLLSGTGIEPYPNRAVPFGYALKEKFNWRPVGSTLPPVSSG